MRLTLLADAMERAAEQQATRVQVVLAAPAGNKVFHGQLARESLRTLGPAIPSVWPKLLRRPDRFGYVDSAVLVARRAATDPALRERYGHMLHD